MSGFKSMFQTLQKYLLFPPRKGPNRDSESVSNENGKFSVSEEIKNLIDKNVYEIYIVSANNWAIRFNLLSMTPTELLTYSSMETEISAHGSWSPFGKYVEYFNKAGPNGEPISLNAMAESLFRDDGVEGWLTPFMGHGNQIGPVPNFEFSIDKNS